MMKKILFIFCIVSSVFVLTTVLTINTMAQDKNKTNTEKSKDDKQKKDVIELKAQRGEATRGGEKDPNVKEEEKPNNPNAETSPPAAKAGNTRGAVAGCRVELDNSTQWRIKIYVDGIYRGTMAAWDDAYVYVAPGLTTVYARADFDDGSILRWGPKEYNCGKNQYIYFKMTN